MTLLFTASFALFKPTEVVFNSSISNLSTSDYKLAASTILANFDESAPVAFVA